jgi:hypothetical protein
MVSGPSAVALAARRHCSAVIVGIAGLRELVVLDLAL